jgi:hypothetical protein
VNTSKEFTNLKDSIMSTETKASESTADDRAKRLEAL